MRVWDEVFQPTYGVLRDEVRDALLRYLECGILAHGCARAECQNLECKHSELIAFSCKRRGLCPSCAAKRAVLFAENLVERVLLPCPHRHCVFTVPKRVRPYFKFNRGLNQHLYRAAWESWKELATEQVPEGTPAAVSALHSAGDLLGFHPHIHGLFLAGVILPEGTYVPVTVDAQRLQELFAAKVLQALVAEGLLSQEDVQNIRSWPHSGFNVFVGEPIAFADRKRLLFLARYLKKSPISNERLSIAECNGETTVHYSSFKDGVKQTRSFAPLAFLAELQQHIPQTWEQTTRFLGIYSCRTRGTKSAQHESETKLAEPDQKSSASWARCMKKIFEIDPLICPKCSSTMKVKAFITDTYQIQRLSTHLGIKEQRAPPPIRYSLPIAA